MNCRVRFEPDGIEISVPNGTLISSAAKLAGVFIDAPCGGNGTCGKCAVTVLANGMENRSLACQTRLESDCTVTISERAALSALQSGTERRVQFEPYPNIDSTAQGACFACFDLGTTTIVCYLLDASDGRQLAVSAKQNPQAVYGADVIARANQVLSSGLPEELQRCALSAMNDLIAETCVKANRISKQVSLITVVGNTVMLHLLLKYPLDRLVRAPYQPYSLERRILPVKDLGLNADKNAVVLIAPVIGGFVGADTVACLTASEFDIIVDPTLLLDIGTNGELAMTNGIKRVCCSTAAGPAFEGANLSCGMRAERGAVDHIWIENAELRYSTVGRAPARGICGSGLIELCAALLRSGVIDETGRFDINSCMSERLISLSDGMLAFLVTDGEHRVTLSQKDVRELQLGKAAIRAGIEVLLDALSLTAPQVEHVLLAGAFGAHISSAALSEIGLLPMEFFGKAVSIGNAAGEGAKLYARNFQLFEESETLARNTEYIELTVSPAFQDYYVDAMSFPETPEKQNQRG